MIPDNCLLHFQCLKFELNFALKLVNPLCDIIDEMYASENVVCCRIGPRRQKICLRVFANSTCADQHAHPHSLISAFVIRFSESIVY